MTTIQPALADFQTALDEMAQADADLCTRPPSITRDRHLTRIHWAKGQVATVQTIAVQITMAMSSVRRGTKIRMPTCAEETAIYALRGGTAILAGVTYAARQFMHAQDNPDAPPAILGILAGANWAALGGLIGTLEGMRK